MLLLIAFSFLAGIFTALSPCILPVLPAILASGTTGGKLRPLGTILGLICSFTFFTLTLSTLVHLTGISPQFLRYAAIALIFAFGLIMIFPPLSNWFAKITAPIGGLGAKIQGKPSGFWSGVLFGIALGLLWTPCAGPILAAITTLVATHALNWTAILMTIAYSIGAGIPMFLFAYGGSKIIQSSQFLSRYSERIRQFFGLLMVLFALVLTFNWDMLINAKLARAFPKTLSEEKFAPFQKDLNVMGPAPELVGIDGWINSPPLTLAELKGKVVLIDFWTYSCINCLRTLPYLEKWYADYGKDGLVIIGVHTPEFQFEKKYENVKEATVNLGVHYPVALDNNYATWNAYMNHYWPAHYLIDQNGNIRMVHFGEGAYEETENAIRSLLGMSPIEMHLPEKTFRSITPETYLGKARGRDNQVTLRGPWLKKNEYIMATGDNTTLELEFTATRVYLVLSGSSATPLEVTLDGKPAGSIIVDSDRKYDIVTTTYGKHLLSLKVPAGIKAYAFTFGDE